MKVDKSILALSLDRTLNMLTRGKFKVYTMGSYEQANARHKARVKPRCFNHTPFGPGFWAMNGVKRGKPCYKWVRHVFTDRCGSHLSPEGIEPYAVLNKLNCEGCIWKPT